MSRKKGSKKCLVFGCKHERAEGKELCSVCHEILRGPTFALGLRNQLSKSYNDGWGNCRDHITDFISGAKS